MIREALAEGLSAPKHRKADRKHGPLVWLQRHETGRQWVRTDFPKSHQIEPVIHECDGYCILSHQALRDERDT